MTLQRVLLVSPTAVTYARHVSQELGRDVFVKHDNATHSRYGGNKVRKLEYLLADARAHNATDIVTVGAAGSHHVLATVVHGMAAGFRVEAVLLPQKRTEHVVATLRAGIAQGATLHAAQTWEAPAKMLERALILRAQGRIPYLVPPGGSTPLGTCGYIDAMAELRQQLHGVGVSSVDVLLCPLGSGATLAGMLAGKILHGVAGEPWGVRVTPRWVSSRTYVAWLANEAIKIAAPEVRHKKISRSDVRVCEVRDDQGYGKTSRETEIAMALFAKDDVFLDATYTGKAAAALIAMARTTPSSTRFLFWNTLSSAPLTALTASTDALPHEIEEILT
jgi:D-cysteine desulfhydrase